MKRVGLPLCNKGKSELKTYYITIENEKCEYAPGRGGKTFVELLLKFERETL